MFLKTKGGEYLFKIDSFWSKSKDPDSAKIYSSSDIDQVNSWLKDGIMPWGLRFLLILIVPLPYNIERVKRRTLCQLEAKIHSGGAMSLMDNQRA